MSTMNFLFNIKSQSQNIGKSNIWDKENQMASRKELLAKMG
jgi:hypothetical protein